MPNSWVELISEREKQLGAATVARMARIFIDDSKTHLSTIAGALSRKELATARAAAHDLTTNASSLRFILLEGAARECERACMDGDHTKAVAAHKGLPALVEICVVQLRHRYSLS
jgi:HPt (histidine-containing phosphotransfer) domain-containing protein